MNILIVDDHTIVRKGLIQILITDFPFALIEEAGDAEDLIDKALKGNWDIIITDIAMPGRSGLDALYQIKKSKPELPVLILSMYPEEQYAVRVIKAGASGYLNKEVAPAKLIEAVKKVLSGKLYITSAVADTMATHLVQENNKLPHHYLSNREFAVMKMLAAGKSVSEIAEAMLLSSSTISTYRTRIFTKLQINNISALTSYVIEHRLNV